MAAGGTRTDLEPLVDALRVELVAAAENAQQLASLEVAHAHHARRLLHARALDVTVEAVRGKTLDLALQQTLRLRLAQSFGKVEQRLVVLLVGVRLLQVDAERRRVAKHRSAHRKHSALS